MILIIPSVQSYGSCNDSVIIESKFGCLANHPQLQPYGYFSSSHPLTLSAFWLPCFMVFLSGDGAKVEALLVLLCWFCYLQLTSSQGHLPCVSQALLSPNDLRDFSPVSHKTHPVWFNARQLLGWPNILSKTGHAVLQIVHSVFTMFQRYIRPSF